MLLIGLVLGLLALGGLAGYFVMYPHGRRPCTLRCMHSALLAYAADNLGNFPESSKDDYDALSKLYPEYAPSGIELAGISGNVEATVDALQNKRSLDSSATSWVYFQGFNKNDDPRIAILWESKAGLYPNGQRNFFGGHAVVFISGDITNIAAVQWNDFVKDQAKLRNESRARHEGKSQ